MNTFSAGVDYHSEPRLWLLLAELHLRQLAHIRGVLHTSQSHISRNVYIYAWKPEISTPGELVIYNTLTQNILKYILGVKLVLYDIIVHVAFC